MITRPKVRRIACWAGVLLGAAAALAYIPCCFTSLAAGSPQRSVVLARGSVSVFWQPHHGGLFPGMYSGLDPWLSGPGWWRWLPKWAEPDHPGLPTPGGSRAMGEVALPLWIPAAFGLLCLYWLLPERPPWHTCECGYDLRAVPRVEGRTTCPECGASRSAAIGEGSKA